MDYDNGPYIFVKFGNETTLKTAIQRARDYMVEKGISKLNKFYTHICKIIFIVLQKINYLHI